MAGRLSSRGVDEGLLRQTPRPDGVLALDDTIAALVELDANGLCLQWRNCLGGTPPAHLPRWLLMRILVARFSQIDGYRCLSLMRASGVVKCQLALA